MHNLVSEILFLKKLILSQVCTCIHASWKLVSFEKLIWQSFATAKVRDCECCWYGRTRVSGRFVSLKQVLLQCLCPDIQKPLLKLISLRPMLSLSMMEKWRGVARDASLSIHGAVNRNINIRHHIRPYGLSVNES